MLREDKRGKEQWPVVNPPSPEEVAWVTREEDPETLAHLFYPTALLLLHGTQDLRVPVESSRLLYQTLRSHYREDPARLSLVEYPEAGHRPTPEMAAAVTAWFQRFLL
jgi:fermentation-respiration switch protein FrsA (DUF1100 family)